MRINNSDARVFKDLNRFVFSGRLKRFFQVKSHKFDADDLHLYLEELNIVPEEYANDKLESKGFSNEVNLQDYPIRGRNVFLHIKRRRWLNHRALKVVYRIGNW